MQRLRLAEPVDAVICALDSLNYVTKPADCRKTFRRVYDALTPGGLFVFDINTPAKLRGLDGQVFLDETDDTYCVWRTEYDEKKRLCYYGMDIFRLEGEHWQRSFEEHIEYAYEPAELQQWLAEAGFTRIRSYGDRVLRAPADGVFEPVLQIGDVVRAGQVAATVAGVPMTCTIDGVLRGLLQAGVEVAAGMKSGDIDPRCERAHCFTASDKARAVGGGVLEAVCMFTSRLEG